MPRLLSALALGLVAAGWLPGVPARAGELALSPCQIEHPLRLTVVPAECGTLEVPEDPARPGGRHIRLHVARVPAINRRRRGDALFVLAGGPGQAATQFYATAAGAFQRIRRERDLVLLDQRGTGGSNALDCPADEDRLYEASAAEVAALARACLAALAAHAQVAQYTTSRAVQDLEAVRAALGYERIDLYAVSYGTRVAQQYLRHHAARVRAAILDGVVPPTLAVGPRVALDAEEALVRILARCAAQAPCRERFGDPRRSYAAVRAHLAPQSVALTLPDPSDGELRTLAFGHEQLATVLRLGAYSADYAALLPLFLDGAAHGDYRALGAQYLLLTRSLAAIALGMHNTVVCSEDVPFWDGAAPDRAALERTFMGTGQVEALRALCAEWPRGPVDADLHQPLVSEVPALFLSGGDDPVTPPAYAHEAAAGFRHALEITLAGFGHGQLTAPCMDRVLADFLARGSVTDLDASCTRAAGPLPFFTSLNGPPP